MQTGSQSAPRLVFWCSRILPDRGLLDGKRLGVPSRARFGLPMLQCAGRGDRVVEHRGLGGDHTALGQGTKLRARDATYVAPLAIVDRSAIQQGHAERALQLLE